ncbi:MAG: zinc ribbon domain-containing protein [Candidatus Hodarchaeales archaeon]
MALFLDVAEEQNVSARGDLERFRHDVEDKTGLSSGFVQACRDRVSALVKPWEDKRDKWQKRNEELQEEITTLEERETKLLQQLVALTPRAVKTRVKKEKSLAGVQEKLAAKRERLERRLARLPRFPSVKKRQPIWFDQRIGKFEAAKHSTGFQYWVTISTLKKREKLVLPVQVYPHAERLLHDPSWSRKSFNIVWDSARKRYAVHLKLEKEVRYTRLHDAWGFDPGMKRLLYGINDSGTEKTVLDSNDREIKRRLSKIKKLGNRKARLQRLGKLRALKKCKNKQYLVAEDLRYVTASKAVKCLPAAPVLVSIGQPKKIREHKGARKKNNPNGRTNSKKHRKRLHNWSFKALGDKLYHESLEHGHYPVIVDEARSRTTSTCSQCGSWDVTIVDRLFECNDCGFKEDRDGNGGLNIKDVGIKRFARRKNRKGRKKKDGTVKPNPLAAVDCDFPLQVSKKVSKARSETKETGKEKEKFGGLKSHATAGTGVDVNGPKDGIKNHPIRRDEPVVKTGEARKIPAG